VREHFYDIEGDLWRSERKLSPSLDPTHILKFSEIKNIRAARPKKLERKGWCYQMGKKLLIFMEEEEHVAP